MSAMAQWLVANGPWLSALSDAATALSLLALLFGALSFWRDYRSGARAEMHMMQEEQARARRATYDALDENYVAFQELALAHPRLNVGEVQMDDPPTLTPDEVYQRRIFYSILLSIFERAFTTYRGVAGAEQQADGWDAFLSHYCKRPAFREAYLNSARRPNGDPTWDEDFVAHLNGKLAALGPAGDSH